MSRSHLIVGEQGLDLSLLEKAGVIPGLSAVASRADLQQSTSEMRRSPRRGPRILGPSGGASSRNPRRRHLAGALVATAAALALLRVLSPKRRAQLLSRLDLVGLSRSSLRAGLDNR